MKPVVVRPMLYGGEQEGRRGTSVVHSYTAFAPRCHPYYASLWFPFSFFATCRTYIHVPCHLQGLTHGGAEDTNEDTNEDIRALLTIGDGNLFKTRGRTPSSKVVVCWWY